MPGIRRALEIAIIDTLEQPNSLARSRALGYLVRAALRAYEVGELDDRLRTLEEAAYRRPRPRRGGRR